MSIDIRTAATGGGDWRRRTALLVGDEAIGRLAAAHVLVVGLGGVGGHAAEAVCRSGVGKMTIVDGDRVEDSNLNRQLAATRSAIGRPKAVVLAERLSDINPAMELHPIHEFIRDARTDELLAGGFDYVIDAIDSLSPKVFLIAAAVRGGLPIVSSMGSGGKLDPSRVAVADIADTHNCQLAKVVRKRLHRLGVRSGVAAVYSPEPVPEWAVAARESEDGKFSSFVGTVSYMPAVFGLVCASVVIRHLASGGSRVEKAGGEAMS